MAPPDHPSAPPAAEPSRWTKRLQSFGRGTLTLVLLGVFALWLHELFVDPAIRPAWKLKVLLVLIPLGVTGAGALLLARLGGWQSRRKR